jgi:hypothetical protein
VSKKDNTTGDRFVGIAEAAAYLGVSVRTVRNMLYDGLACLAHGSICGGVTDLLDLELASSPRRLEPADALYGTIRLATMLKETWKEQYDRMQRSHELLELLGEQTMQPQDMLVGTDVLYHFCSDAFHLRDWIAATLGTDKKVRKHLRNRLTPKSSCRHRSCRHAATLRTVSNTLFFIAGVM